MAFLKVILLSVIAYATLALASYGYSNVDEDDTWILVMGLTGAGKSTFIRKATDNPEVRVCNSAYACTRNPEFYSISLPDQDGRMYGFNLIDTPGFNDAEMSDTEVLRRVAEYLAYLGRLGVRPHAVLYMHRATGKRFDRGDMTSLAVVKQLVGPAYFAKVVFVTTMWDDVGRRDKAEQLIEQLARNSSIWGDVVSAGGSVVPFEDSVDSAWRILSHVYGVAYGSPPVPLLIQQEMVDWEKPFEHTEAYWVLNTFNLVDEIQRLYFAKKLNMTNLASLLEVWLKHLRKDMIKKGLPFLLRMFDMAWWGTQGPIRNEAYSFAIQYIRDNFPLWNILMDHLDL